MTARLLDQKFLDIKRNIIFGSKISKFPLKVDKNSVNNHCGD